MSANSPRFTQGSTMRHVIVLTLSSALGLMSVFAVDFISIWYIQLLGDDSQTSAAGFAGALIFFSISSSVGIMIGTSALVGRHLGARREELAREYAFAGSLIMFAINTVIMIVMIIFAKELLSLLGAKGETLEHAYTYLVIVLLGTPFIALAIGFSGILRAKGEAMQAMLVTLLSGIFTAVVDPIFIFSLGLELKGAAIAACLSRVVAFGIGFYYCVIRHNLIKIPSWQSVKSQIRDINVIALPAILTNIATPFGNSIIISQIAIFGDEVVAGWAVVDRMVPLVFGTIFALSGAVGPIIAQNYGAIRFDRVRQTLIDGHVFNIVYVLIAWGILYLLQDSLIRFFNATGDKALVIQLFCTIYVGGFIFNGALFVSNAAFNNLEHPLFSTYYNWGRATLGTIPFIYFGRVWGGLEGLTIGLVLGFTVFGTLASIHSFKLVNQKASAQKESVQKASS